LTLFYTNCSVVVSVLDAVIVIITGIVVVMLVNLDNAGIYIAVVGSWSFLWVGKGLEEGSWKAWAELFGVVMVKIEGTEALRTCGRFSFGHSLAITKLSSELENCSSSNPANWDGLY